jgi:dephospho-CoA kinase
MSALRVGVTGGIGSGKTALTDRLASHGITIVDADLVAREVVAPGSEALALIAERHGENILQDDGSLDRAALRRIVFADEHERQWLESITHPRIGALMAERLAAATEAYVVLSSPLLLEGSQRILVDHVVVVDVPEALQVQRTMIRDDNSEALVKSIMAAQLPREERLRRADRVVDNSGNLDDLMREADALHQDLLALAKRT